MEELEGRTAVVTGAGAGIGRCLGYELVRQGAVVAMLDIEERALDRMLSQAPEDVPVDRLKPYLVDVLDRDQYAEVATRIDGELGGVDVLANNAGVAVNRMPLWETDYRDIDWCVGVNLLGTIHGIKNFVPGIISRGRGGHVIATASIGGFQVRKSDIWFQGLYAATKAGVVALSEGLRQDLEPYGIGVTVLAPSAVRTEIATSDRNRPRRFGGPGTGAQDPRVKEVLDRGRDPSEVARLTCRAIVENRLYVFTEPRDRALVEARHRRIEAAFPPADGREPAG